MKSWRANNVILLQAGLLLFFLSPNWERKHLVVLFNFYSLTVKNNLIWINVAKNLRIFVTVDMSTSKQYKFYTNLERIVYWEEDGSSGHMFNH